MNGNNREDQARNKRVFVINESVEVLRLIRDLLQSEGYCVTIATVESLNWEDIPDLHPDLVMIDLVPGHQKGWDLLERLRQEAGTQRIPIIISSTDPRLVERAQQYAERYGGARYIAKPFEIDELFQDVDDLIGSAKR
jgi:DNA-binding response OmpR family regulator